MFVPESTLFMEIKIKIQILSAEGLLLSKQMSPKDLVEVVKDTAVSHFYPQESTSAAAAVKPEQFRIVHLGQSRTLNDGHALEEEKVTENDVLMLIRRREPRAQDPVNDQDLKAPTLAEIIAATSHLERPEQVSSKSAPSTSADPDNPVDFQLELRKIIISLVSVMATLLHGNTDADLICKEMHSRIKHRLAAAASKNPDGLGLQTDSVPEIQCNPMGIVHGLAEAKKREFRPNQKAVEALREMGFNDKDIADALRACKNNKDQACEWLLSGGRVVLDDIETGLDQASHLFNALVTNPTIRLGLNCPKTLLAFLGILESPASANTWLADPDTAPVLSAIFKIYHAEKHAVPEL